MTSLSALAPQTSRMSTLAWGLSALVAVALHASVALGVLWTMNNEEADDDIGAPALEIALDVAAPKAEPDDAPPGPQSNASAASPESAEAKAKTEDTSQPKDDPVEAENPDRIVSPQEPKKPEEKIEEPKQAPSQASTASVAAEDTAPPAQETTQSAPVARAPAIGPGRATLLQRATWQRRLVAHLDRHKRYPPDGGRQDARVEVSFTLDRSGHVLAASVAHSSGRPNFDAAALAMVRRSDPVPAPPPLVADEGLTFTIPVVFRAERR